MRPGEPYRTRHREVYGAACFFGGVASPVSIKARSWHALDQLLNCTSHMLCLWDTVNRRSLQHHRVGSGVVLTGWISPFLRARNYEHAESSRLATVRKYVRIVSLGGMRR